MISFNRDQGSSALVRSVRGGGREQWSASEGAGALQSAEFENRPAAVGPNLSSGRLDDRGRPVRRRRRPAASPQRRPRDGSAALVQDAASALR